MVLNTLTSEFVIIDNPLPNDEQVSGIHLMNQFAFIFGKSGWCRFDLRGNLLANYTSPEDTNQWSILGKVLRVFVYNNKCFLLTLWEMVNNKKTHVYPL